VTGSGASDPWAEQRRPPPEAGIGGEPAIEILAKGSRIWRIHGSARGALEFDTRVPDRLRGGRFNSPSGEPGVFYAADTLEGAVAEVLLRDVPLADEGARAVPLRQILGRAVSVLEVTRELRVVALHGAGAAAVGQGLWLTKSDSADYPLTRQWGRAIRERVADAAGFVWRARHDEDRLAYALYEDGAADALGVRVSIPIDEGIGLEAVRVALLAHRAVVDP